MSYDALPLLCHNIAVIVNAILGRSKKCLVLDLDHTLWGGVIGDDGVDGIQIGQDTALGDAYLTWQQYILQLKNRGILLAICSKNDEENAKAGLMHRKNALNINDFTVIKANWQTKHENIHDIAQQLNIGLSSIVFADDNPTEQEIVRKNLQEVTVLKIDHRVEQFITTLDQSGLFEPTTISHEDVLRNKMYQENQKRQENVTNFLNYDDYLASLNMSATIEPIYSHNITRVHQLINKTNQFNLTTKRYTLAEVEEAMTCQHTITLCSQLKDKFGDNGLVTILIGKANQDDLHIQLWLMSCRVLKRNLEHAMLDTLIHASKKRGIKRLYGYYYKSERNNMVADHYRTMNFTHQESHPNGDSIWRFDLDQAILPKNNLIKVSYE